MYISAFCILYNSYIISLSKNCSKKLYIVNSKRYFDLPIRDTASQVENESSRLYDKFSSVKLFSKSTFKNELFDVLSHPFETMLAFGG
jgi:hypothetical protein